MRQPKRRVCVSPFPENNRVSPCHIDKWPTGRERGAREFEKIRFVGSGLDLRARCALLIEAPIPAIQISAAIPPHCNSERADWVETFAWASSEMPAC